MNRTRPFVVGLIGGIGSGKSAAAEAFVQRGARAVNADRLGHEALRQPEVRDAIVALWGSDLLTAEDAIDRRKLAGIVFGDPAELAKLEALTHPWITRRIEEEITRAGEDGVALVVLDAAVLLEAGWHNVCDRLVYVDAPPEVRLARVTGGRGWSGDDWQAREAAQLPLTQKHARADHVLENSSTLEHLGRQVDDLLHHWGRVPAGASRATLPPRS